MENQLNTRIKKEAMQGGLWEDNHPLMLPPIAHENTAQSGIRHVDGAISMARLAPGSASSEFFICIGDQPELGFGGRRNPDGQGFAAFGRVIKGKDVVNRIQGLCNSQQMLEQKVLIRYIKRQ